MCVLLHEECGACMLVGAFGNLEGRGLYLCVGFGLLVHSDGYAFLE